MVHINVSGMPLQEVMLDRIDDSAGPFCMSFGFDLGPLMASINAVGLVNPPVLRRDQGEMAVVAGYRRIKALKALNKEKIPCRILRAEDMSPLQCLLLNLHDNLAGRGLNDMEKAMALQRLSVWTPQQELATRYMPLLGLPPDEKGLFFFLEMELNLDGDTKAFIAQGRLSSRTVRTLSQMDKTSGISLMKGISSLNLNFNQQLQFIDYIVDLAHIEDKTIPQIVAESGFDRKDQHQASNRPQKAREALNGLRKRRNPSIARAEERFRRMVSDLNLPHGMRIDAPPFFEGSDYRLEVLFRQGEDLQLKLERLIQAGRLGQLRNPWEETSG